MRSQRGARNRFGDDNKSAAVVENGLNPDLGDDIADAREDFIDTQCMTSRLDRVG
jgi:hypothetical protein